MHYKWYIIRLCGRCEKCWFVTSHVLFTLIKIIKHYQIQRNRVKYRYANVSVKIIKHYQIQRKYIKHVFAKLAKGLLIMLLKVIFVGGFLFPECFTLFLYMGGNCIQLSQCRAERASMLV